MTWQSAKSVAERMLQRMNLPPNIKGAQIRLADYESDEDLKFLKGPDEWPLEFHRMVNGAIARELRKRGATVTLIKISMAEYFDWLVKNKIDNNPAHRAKFIAEKTTPGRKNPIAAASARAQAERIPDAYASM